MNSPIKDVFKVNRYLLKDNGKFPNSRYPVLHYRQALDIPLLFPAWRIRMLFAQNGWTNSWKNGIYDYAHYHSVTHEVLAIIHGDTILQLGGEGGQEIHIAAGDVLVIPAGVAHRNMRPGKRLVCVGAYPEGKDYDIQTGLPMERPKTDENIAQVPLPETDPLEGGAGALPGAWRKSEP